MVHLKNNNIIFSVNDLHNFQFPQPSHYEAENLLNLPVYNGAGNSFKNLPRSIFRNSS
jgi:hypothetical protein